MTTIEYNTCVDLYADKVFRFIRKNTREDNSAKDIVQDSFLKLWQKKDEVRFETVKSYLFTMAYRVMIDMFRKQNRITALESANFDSLSHSTQYSDLKEILDKAIQCLPSIQREVILLRDYEGYSYEEIGEITSLNASQVKVYIYRGRKSLKQILIKLNVHI